MTPAQASVWVPADSSPPHAGSRGLSPALTALLTVGEPALLEALSQCLDATGRSAFVFLMGPAVVARVQATAHVAGVLRAEGLVREAEALEVPRSADRIVTLVLADNGEMALMEYRRPGINSPGGDA